MNKSNKTAYVVLPRQYVYIATNALDINKTKYRILSGYDKEDVLFEYEPDEAQIASDDVMNSRSEMIDTIEAATDPHEILQIVKRHIEKDEKNQRERDEKETAAVQKQISAVASDLSKLKQQRMPSYTALPSVTLNILFPAMTKLGIEFRRLSKEEIAAQNLGRTCVYRGHTFHSRIAVIETPFEEKALIKCLEKNLYS